MLPGSSFLRFFAIFGEIWGCSLKMDVIMRWLSLFCFGYTYYELCTTIKLDISDRPTDRSDDRPTDRTTDRPTDRPTDRTTWLLLLSSYLRVFHFGPKAPKTSSRESLGGRATTYLIGNAFCGRTLKEVSTTYLIGNAFSQALQGFPKVSQEVPQCVSKGPS